MTNDPSEPLGGSLDFGDDASVELPQDAAFDAWIQRAAPQLNVPTATPKLEMWAAIRAAQPRASTQRELSGVTSLKRPRWFWPAVIAAAMVAGVGVDRMMLNTGAPERVAEAPRAAADSSVRSGDAGDPSGLYRLAAEQTLTQAEALLTAYRTSDIATRNPASARQLGNWGRDILSSTRLLLDSPASTDPRLRALLGDLELVLVQIIHLSGTPLDSSDRALIDGALRDRDLLPRIRTAVPAGTASAASDD